MKKRWNSLLALLMVVALCVPAFTCASSSSVAIYYVVTADGKPVNLRSACELDDSNIIGSIPYGTELMVYDFNYGGAWALVEFQGTMGYVMTRYLDANNPYYNPYPPYAPVYPIYPDPAPTVTPTKKPSSSSSSSINYNGFQPTYYLASVKPSTPSGYVNMRWAPSKSTAVHNIYYSGDLLQVIAENNSWCQVYDTQRNICGFMMKQFLTVVSYGMGVN